MTCYQLTVTGSGTLVPKGVKFPEAYSKTGPGLGFSIHADLSDYPIPGPELIAGGTEATPQLLTFGEISGPPAATGGASAPAASAPAASAPAATPTKVADVASSTPIPASTSAVAEAASSVAISSSVVTPVASSTAELPTETSVEVSSAVEVPSAAPTSELPIVSAPYPSGNTTAKPTATGAPIVSSSLLPPPIISDSYSAAPGPVVPTTFATSVRPKPTDVPSGSIKEYFQCGGSGYSGAGTCAEGLECKAWNPYYSQCVKPEATRPGPSKGPAPTSASAPSKTAAPSAPAEAEPTVVDPVDVEPVPSATASAPSAPVATQPPVESAPGEKTYTLETFIAFLEQEAGSESAAKIRRMIEALQY